MRIAFFVLFALISSGAVAAPTEQLPIGRVELMPNNPEPFKAKDWRAVAHGFDTLAFNFNARGQYLPLIWWDDSRVNIDSRGFGLPSYLRDPNPADMGNHEALTVLGSLLGATVSGIDKSAGENNFATMAEQYFNSRNGLNLVQNHPSVKTGSTYWYELYPQVLFDCLADRYPKIDRLTHAMRLSSDRWNDAYEALAATPDGLNFDHTAFDFATMKPVYNGKWREPDAAAAIAWIQYVSYRKFGDEKFLAAADGCMKALSARQTNPAYEVMLPSGAYTAARLNAELGRNYDVDKIVQWCFEPSTNRSGWGVIVGTWGGRPCNGMIGSTTDGGGYGFVMNTFATAASLVPMVRYDERFARAIGKWMLNASNTIRLCYPDELPPDMQSSPGWKSDPPNVIAYEGLRRERNGKRPFATGDPIANKWGPCDLGVYGSAFVGIFGGIILPTDDPKIPQLDLLATDFFRGQAYPSFLLYNPYNAPRSVTIKVAPGRHDLYDAVANDFVARGAEGSARITIAPDSACVIVMTPSGGKVSYDGMQTLVDGVVVDYDNGRAARPAPAPRTIAPDQSRTIYADRATITVDGDAREWQSLHSSTVSLDTAGRGKLQANVRYAWDDDYLYILCQQAAQGKDAHEAPNVTAFAAARWDFDCVWVHLDLANGRLPSMGELVFAAAFSSSRLPDLFFAPEAPENGSANIKTATSGTADAGNRVIEARISWRGLIELTFGGNEKLAAQLGKIGPGLRFGADPLLVEMNHTRQSYVGGAQYIKPSGTDNNSIDVVLRDESSVK
jgi:hypothetical protein